MKEVWKDIKDYEGLYQVSNLGRVKSLPRKRVTPTKGTYYSVEKILKPGITDRGYQQVALCKDSKLKRCLIHRLVAQTFIPNSNNYPEVNHKDENKVNNVVENLEWCTSKYNANYGTRKERLKEKSINKPGKRVICITTGEVFETLSKASKATKTDASDIGRCCKGKRKSAGKHPVTGEKLIWKFLEEDNGQIEGQQVMDM